MLDLPLACLHRPVSPTEAAPWLLVLMHGVGSQEADLFGLADSLPPRWHVLSLRAPFALGPDAWAWFRFQVTPEGRRLIEVEQEQHSRALLLDAVQAAGRQLGVPPQRVVVGGFSQGGIMALSLLLTQPQILRAGLVMHSRLLPEALPRQAPDAALAGRSLWLSYGLADAVLPPAFTQTIVEHVSALPLDLQGAGFPGGHTITEAEWRAVLGWLERLDAGR